MTYGEASIAYKETARMVNGEVVFDEKFKPFPARMSREIDKSGSSEAGRYYNKKLRKHWIKSMDDNIPDFFIDQALDYILGRRSR